MQRLCVRKKKLKHIEYEQRQAEAEDDDGEVWDLPLNSVWTGEIHVDVAVSRLTHKYYVASNDGVLTALKPSKH